MSKLILQNYGWPVDRANDVGDKLIPVAKKLKELLDLKSNIIVHLYKNKSKDDKARAEYDEGVIILYENCPDFVSDFLHEFSHQLLRPENMSLWTKRILQKIKKKLEKNKGDGRIFIQPHTYSEEKEIFATYFRWYISGKIIDDGYIEVLNNFQPDAVKIVEKIINKDKLIKSKVEPVGIIKQWKGGKYQKVSQTEWKKIAEKKEKIKEFEKKKILAKGLNKDIDFKANEKLLNDEIKDVFEKDKLMSIRYKDWGNKEWKEVKNEFESFTQNLTPVHSLSVEKFLKVLKSGGLKALSELEESGKQNGYAYIETEIRPKYGDDVSKLIYKMIEKQLTLDDVEKIKNGLFNILKSSKKVVDELVNIQNKINKIISEQKEGAIGYDVDREIGTNKHVFSILGPNGNGSGYGEISIVMKQDIMQHPDFNMTPCAGTSFVSGEMYGHRRYSQSSRNKIKEELNINLEKLPTKEEMNKIGKSHFHKSKLNAKENLDYYKYMAKDIAAQGSIDDYLNRQSHGKWEGHLPTFVAVNMFQEVIMTKDIKHILEDEYFIKKYPNYKLFDKVKKEKLYKESINELNNKIKNIKIVDNHDEILPYMNESFREGKWKSKK